MRKWILYTIAAVVMLSCRKEKRENSTPVAIPANPVMTYKDLKNAEVKYSKTQTLDIDNDGTMDFYFSVLLVGDPLLQRDMYQFYANSTVKRNLLNDAQDQSPLLNKYDLVKKDHPGYTWYEISAIKLAEKVVTSISTFWQGQWKSADHNYLPVQIEKNGKVYHGWIELSFDTTNERLILHKAAISQEENKEVQAGV